MNSTLTYTNPAFSILNLQLFSSSSWVTLSQAMQSNLNIPKWVLNIYNATSKSPHPPAKSCLPPTLCTTLPLSLSLLFLLHKPHTNCCYIAKGLANIFICSLCSGHTTNTRHTHRHTHPKCETLWDALDTHPKKKRGETEKEKKKTKQKCMKLFYSKCMRYVKILWVSRELGVRRIPFPPNLMCLCKGASSIFPAWIKWI